MTEVNNDVLWYHMQEPSIAGSDKRKSGRIAVSSQELKIFALDEVPA